MRYRIKQTDKSTFIVQGSLESLSSYLGGNAWFTLNRQGEPFVPFREKRFFELRDDYRDYKFNHNQEKAFFFSIEIAKQFIKECKITYPKYHKA
jgi:hypothetical protein